MAGYTKEFLIDAFLSRHLSLEPAVVGTLKVLAEDLYESVGKDKFRTYASLDADAIKKYKVYQEYHKA